MNVSLTDAAIVLEGPIGGRRNASWLVSVRKSYLDQLLRRLDPENDFGFGFSDLQTKVVYDVNSRHQLQVAVAAGRSRLDRVPDNLDIDDVKDGRNATAVGVVTWRYMTSPRLVITQKFASGANTFRNTTRNDVEVDRGKLTEAVYRVDWSYAPGARTTFEGGAQATRSTSMQLERVFTRSQLFEVREHFDERAHSESAYAQDRFTIGRAGVTAGARMDHWSRTGDTAASPWAQAAVPLAAGLIVKAGAGIYRQPPAVFQLSGFQGSSDLALERAYQVDGSIEGPLASSAKWQVTGYDREDRDFVRVDSEFRVSQGTLVLPSLSARYRNMLDGHSRGVDLQVQRRAQNGLSGWLAYSLSYTRYHD